MMPDKSWIDKPIRSSEFLNGVVQFLDFAFSNASINRKILCPCIKCGFQHTKNRVEVLSHLLEKGFPTKYTSWYMHGEECDESNVENLSQDKEHAASSGVPSKIFVESNDAFGKVFGPKHPSRVCSLEGGASSVRTNTSSVNVPGVCMEDLVKQVNSLQENLVGYQEIKKQLSQIQAKLSILYKFFQDKFDSDIPNLHEDIPHP